MKEVEELVGFLLRSKNGTKVNILCDRLVQKHGLDLLTKTTCLKLKYNVASAQGCNTIAEPTVS